MTACAASSGLDRDERLIQERLCQREKIAVATGDGGELDSSAFRNHSATALPTRSRNEVAYYSLKKDNQDRRVIENDHPGSPRSS